MDRGGQPLKTTLVSVAELAAHPSWRRIDCRFDLMQPKLGVQQYAGGHIPGALYAHLDADLSGAKTGRNGRHPLPERAAFVAWLERHGITADDQVVAYDASGGAYAARLWWLMRWVGHRAVAVLDGGIGEWVRQGQPLEIASGSPQPSRYVAGLDSMPTVDTDAVMRNLRSRGALVLDARAAGRYAGIGETIDPVAGHIPGARNRPFADNLDADGRFKSPEVLRAEFAAVLADPPAAAGVDTPIPGAVSGGAGAGGGRFPAVIAQCGSGVTACHNLLAMTIAGITDDVGVPGVSLYPGSWSEWVSAPSRPVATGPNP
jgi:thiosulfate/3-mercaptopyruvate sulfurtransferase